MKGFTVVFLMMIATSIFSQTLEEIELCTALQSNQFYSEVEADSALDRILDASGLAKNFTLTQCDNIDNAAAISYKGVRYILYDKEFLQTITDYTNDWANLFILAHEVGHHLNGHSVDVSMIDIVESKTLETKRRQELEADEFAAFILAQLGAPLTALIEPIELVVSDGDDTYSSHPNKSKRLNAIRKGYKKYEPKIITKVVDSKTRKYDNKLIDGEWQTEDFTSNPFRDFDYISAVEAKNTVGEYDIENVFEIKYKEELLNGYKTWVVFFYLKDIHNLNNLLRSRLEKFISSNKEYFVKRDGYSLDGILKEIDYTLAIDGDIVAGEDIGLDTFGGEGWIPFIDNYGEYQLSVGLKEKRIFFKTFNDAYLDRESEISKRKMFNRLISKLKSGSKLYVRIDILFARQDLLNEGFKDENIVRAGFDISEKLFLDMMYANDGKKRFKALNYIGYIEPIVLEFSLKGSSVALKALESLPLNQ